MTEIGYKVDWSDLDLFGHVNNVSFFKFIQSARVNFCEKIGLITINEKDKPGFIVASTSCDFLNPLNYQETILVKTKVKRISNSSFELEHSIQTKDKKEIATGKDILVVFDYSKNQKVVIDSDLKEKIERFGE